MGAVVKLKEKKAGFMDVLQKTAKAKPAASTKKSSVPMLDAPQEVKEAVDLYVDAKEREKIATAEMDMAGGTIITFVRPVQDKDGFSGSFRNSYGVPGTKPGISVKFVSMNKFSINAEDSEKIEEILGEHFEEMMEKTYSVKLKPTVFQDPALQAELMELVGERFTDFFDTEQGLKVKEDFDEKIYRSLQPEAIENLRVFCRQYKPSLR